MEARRRKLYLAILVNMIIPIAGMSTDIYLPSLPAISTHFNIHIAFAQLTVTSFVIAMGFAQFFAGPVSDAYGRRKLLLAATSTQVIAILAILFSPTIYWMILYRFIQGVGAAFMIVPARAIINDIFEGHQLKKQFNYCTISFAASPIVAPFIGGYIQHYFGWQANFIVILALVAFILCLVVLFYRETIPTMHPFSIGFLWKNYCTILSNRHFLSCALFASLVCGYTALFNVAGPFIVQVELHRTAITYGHIALTMGVAWFSGNALNRILFHYSRKTKTQIALWLLFLTTSTMLAMAMHGLFNLRVFTFPTFLIIFLNGFMFPIYVGECMSIFTDLAASANACLFGIAWFVFGIFTILATLLKTHSLIPIAFAYFSINVISLLFYYIWLVKLK